MVLRSFLPILPVSGRPARPSVCPFAVVVSFSWRGRVACVSWFFFSRRRVARLLWRLRAARRWWRSSSAPSRSVVGRSAVPRFCLRWVVAAPCVVSVFRRGFPGRRFRLPSPRLRRSPGSRCPLPFLPPR